MDYLVSMLVPIYGVEKYIKRCAVSLFEQTYCNIEYVFVDDCSPDNSMEILKEVINEYPHRADCVKIIRHEHNEGLAVARNSAVAAAKGEFLMHVDSDDYIENDTVEKCVLKQQENNADLVSFGCYREYKTKTVVQVPPMYKNSKDMCLSLIKKSHNGNIINVGVWGRMIRKSLYIDNHIIVEPGINMAEDYQVITRLSYFANSIGIINEPLYHYNLQNVGSYVNNISKKNALQSERSFNIVFDFFVNKGEEFQNAVNVGLANHLIRRTIDGIDNDFGEEYYKELCSKWIGIPRKIKSDIPFFRQILFVNYKFTKLFVALVRLFKH